MRIFPYCEGNLVLGGQVGDDDAGEIFEGGDWDDWAPLHSPHATTRSKGSSQDTSTQELEQTRMCRQLRGQHPTMSILKHQQEPHDE